MTPVLADKNNRPIDWLTLAVLAGLGAAVFWAYWPTLVAMWERWNHDPQYNHGYFVPVFSLVLLGIRRKLMPTGPLTPAMVGLPVLLGGMLIYGIGTFLSMEWFLQLSLLPCLAGICLLIGGWSSWRWAWPAVLFLIFMIPLPNTIENLVSYPMQRLATIASTYVLQTLGFSVFAEGNVIILNDYKITVAEACNGLSMMLFFFATATGLLLIVPRPWLDRGIIMLSAAPIAIVANVIRITTTGLLHELVNPQVALYVYDNLAGWFMMPVAIVLLLLEFWLLTRLLIERPAEERKVYTGLATMRRTVKKSGPKATVL